MTATETPLGVGIIGAGPRANAAHLPSIARLQQRGAVRLVAICDLDERRLTTAADRYGVGADGRYTDYRRMLREAGLDAVYATLQPTQVLSIVRDVLDAGGKAFLLLGRGGSGKTEVAKALCKNGAGLIANTHLLIGGGSVCGIKTTIRFRDNGTNVYIPLSQQQGFNMHGGWLPIGGVFWVKYRTDGRNVVELLPSSCAKANLRYFSEAIRNWELKEDIADDVNSDPIAFAERVNRIDQMLNDFCDSNEVYYLNVDIFSNDGMERLISVMEASP